MLLIRPRFEFMEQALGTEIALHSLPPFTTNSSPYTKDQYWFHVSVWVNGLRFPGPPLTFIAKESGHVIGAEHGMAPGLADVVTFDRYEEIHGRKPNMPPDEMFSPEYHYKWFGEGRDRRSPVEKFGRLD